MFSDAPLLFSLKTFTYVYETHSCKRQWAAITDHKINDIWEFISVKQISDNLFNWKKLF